MQVLTTFSLLFSIVIFAPLYLNYTTYLVLHDKYYLKYFIVNVVPFSFDSTIILSPFSSITDLAKASPIPMLSSLEFFPL